MSNQPDLTKFSGAIFWDTAIENIALHSASWLCYKPYFRAR